MSYNQETFTEHHEKYDLMKTIYYSVSVTM